MSATSTVCCFHHKLFRVSSLEDHAGKSQNHDSHAHGWIAKAIGRCRWGRGFGRTKGLAVQVQWVHVAIALSKAVEREARSSNFRSAFVGKTKTRAKRTNVTVTVHVLEESSLAIDEGRITFAKTLLRCLNEVRLCHGVQGTVQVGLKTLERPSVFKVRRCGALVVVAGNATLVSSLGTGLTLLEASTLALSLSLSVVLKLSGSIHLDVVD